MRKCIGYKIKKIREIRNISQEYVARNLGISQSAYSCIENNRIKLDDEKLIRIASILDVKKEIIENFSEQAAFSFKPSFEAINPIEAIQNIYEKLLAEKEARIQLLQAMLKR